MQERCLKVDVNVSWHLVWLLALLEGITVPLVPLFLQSGPHAKPTAHAATATAKVVSFGHRLMINGVFGLAIGFIGASIVCLLLNHIVFRRLQVRLNNAPVLRVSRPLVAALWGGLLLAVIFWIQQCIGRLLVFPMTVNLVLFGFVSAAGSIVVIGFVYLLTASIVPFLGIQLTTTEQRLLLAKFPIMSFAVLVGLYEGLAAPIFQRWDFAPQHKVLIALLVGLSGGALSASIVVGLAHMHAIKKHLWLKFAVLGE